MKKGFVWLVIFVAVVLVAVMTCPNKNAHKDAIMADANEAINSQVRTSGESAVADALGLFSGRIASGIIGWALDADLDVDNYFVCSVGKVTWQNERKVASIGLLGHVFVTFDSEKLLDEIAQDL